MSNKSLLRFLIQYLSENKYCFINTFEGTGLKHYGCELFSPTVHAYERGIPDLRILAAQNRDHKVIPKVYRSL